MAQKNDSGDKTEQPTAKKLLDARKKGDVPKSKEITSTIVLLLWLSLFGIALVFAGDRISALMTLTFESIGDNFSHAAPALGWAAFETALFICALFIIPIAAFGTLVEFLQTGPVLSLEKLKPKLENLNPAEGLKRMFGLDSLVEGLKSLAKTILLFLIGWWVIESFLPEILSLLYAPTPYDIGDAMWEVAIKLLAWTIGIFVLLALLDALYQRYSFTKKMRMSMRDIKQELKDTEGDPHIKAQRKQAHQEWTQQNSVLAAQDATALVVNPTHVAIAVNYDKEICPVPTISAKGEDHVARAMREAAEEANVPIVRNVALARDLLVRSEVGELIPRDLFNIIAEVILWAQNVSQKIDQDNNNNSKGTDAQAAREYAPPGEDLTVYPNTSDI